MELALEAVKSCNLLYHEAHTYTQVAAGGCTLADLPLIPANRSKKGHKEFFQTIKNISADHVKGIQDAFVDGKLDIATLPAIVRPRDALGEACRLQLVVEQTSDGAWHALKFFHSTVDIPFGLVRTLCEDAPQVINYKVASNSHLVKMAFLKMVSAIQGHQWLTQSLQDKPLRGAGGKIPGADNKWDPTEEELRDGIAFINVNAPLSNSKNEQYLWVLLQVRDGESPIHGWPEHVVLKACTNRVTGNSQAEPEWFFPLLMGDLNPEFLKQIVPLVVPRMTSFGLMILGKAGIGKTPVAQILCMAVARHIINNRSLEVLPGIRKAKQIDGFRERPGEIHIPVILDDPNLSGINLEDLKSFLDVGETSLVDARYRAAKFVRNQCRVILNNEWDDTKEPAETFLETITWDDFKGMFLTACQHPKVPHLMAILKRTTVVIAGHRGVYVRLPSEHNTEPIYGFAAGGITEDWLRDKNKAAYGLYKQGVHQKYAEFEKNLAQEQELVAYLLGTPEEREYMERAHRREQWRAEAGMGSQPTSVAATANLQQHPRVAASSAPPADLTPSSPKAPVQLKEELQSPVDKRARLHYGVIDVEAQENAAAACAQADEAMEEMQSMAGDRGPQLLDDDVDDDEEDVLGLGFTLGS